MVNMSIEQPKQKSVPQKEEEVLQFWRENQIFEKSMEQRKGAPDFVFYDGPPFATGLPHYGHILASVLKDVVPRYQTMRGRYVPRRWGWDCHGLPVENIVEQELKLEHKKDIEKFGIDKFNRIAEQTVLRYADDWKKIIPRIGRWVDMENDYRTMDWTYTETVWWIFATLYKKGLISEGYKSMHLCPRCETTLANFEVSLGYKEIKDISVTVKFKLADEADTYFLAWTTTPWTLPGNVALAVNPDIEYVKVKFCANRDRDGKPVYENYILSKAVLEKMAKGEKDSGEMKYWPPFGITGLTEQELKELRETPKILESFSGSELVGKVYKPLFDSYANKTDLVCRENGWKVYAADFVTTDEGTGIVHIAPAFGDEDMQLGKKEELPFIQHVNMDGTFKPDVTDFAGLPVKPKGEHQKTDVEIIKYLDARSILFSKKTITHSYPHCWRCDTPLLNYAASSWFVNVTKIKDQLLANNQKIEWTPQHLKEGRFGKGLETAPDWAISRSRFWGAPLPVWRCAKCRQIKVVGSLNELEQHWPQRKNEYFILRHGERQDLLVSDDPAQMYKRASLSANPAEEIHLTEQGRKDIEKVAEVLHAAGKFDFIFASDFVRTRETAEIVSKRLGVPVVYDLRLRELNVGREFEGKTVEEYLSFFKNPADRFTYKPEGGESLEDVQRRMVDMVREVDAANEGKRVLIISHGDPLWVLENALKGLSHKQMLQMRHERYLHQGELRKLAVPYAPYDEDGRLNLHRPYIDKIKFICDCRGEMSRIPEVFDCWFESGSMPYGQAHYPFLDLAENRQPFEPKEGKSFPAHFIAEGLDQTRGWFYSLHVLATALFESPAYKYVLVNGTLLAEDGQKMSKRLKNYPDPVEIVNKYGADALRLYLLSSPAVYAEDMNFSEKGVDEVSKKMIARLNNVYSFYAMYAGAGIRLPVFGASPHALDKFIVYELLQTKLAVEKAMESYRLDRATRALADFADVFSTVYLQYSRDRFKEGAPDRDNALAYFRYALAEFSKILAPFAPFMAEYLYSGIKGEDARESVHLEDWPELDPHIAEYKDAREQMGVVRSAIEGVLAARSKAGISVRQPLASAVVRELPKGEEYQAIVRDRVNCEKLEEDAALTLEEPATIDTNITDDLREKGMLRELIRSIQEARKQTNLVPGDRIKLSVQTDEASQALIHKFEEEIKKAVSADSITLQQGESGQVIKLEQVS